MSVRASKEEIERRILDVTAGLIARHGVRATTTQLVADAVGFSKASIFHRFENKDRLIQLAVRACIELGALAHDQVRDLAPGPAKDESALAAILDLGLQRPGFLALMLSSVTVREPGEFGPGAEALADSLLAMFDLERPARANDVDRLFRVIGALSVLSVLGLAYRDYADEATARRVILASAVSAIG